MQAASRSDEYLEMTLRSAKALVDLADAAEAASDDAGCAALYGIVRDCGYRIRGEAERERAVHKSRMERAAAAQAEARDRQRPGEKP